MKIKYRIFLRIFLIVVFVESQFIVRSCDADTYSSDPVDPIPENNKKINNNNKESLWFIDFESSVIEDPYSIAAIESEWPWHTWTGSESLPSFKRTSYVDGLPEDPINDYVAIENFDGSNVMRNFYKAGNWGIGYEDKNTGGTGVNIFSCLTSSGGWEELYLSYNVWFDDGFDWQLGGKMPGLLALPGPDGRNPPKKDQGGMYLMMWQPGGANKIYDYFHEKDPYEYGRGPKTPITFSTGQWYNISQRFVMSQVGVRDGIHEVYIDGVLVASYRDMTREQEGIYLNVLMWSTFQGGGSATYAPNNDGESYIDDIDVWFISGAGTAEHPVGRVASPSGRDISAYIIQKQ